MSGSSEKKTDTEQTTNPWAPQAQALTGAFDQAGKALTAANGVKAPTDFTAQMTPEQLSTFRSMIERGGNTAIPGQMATTGSTLQGAGTAGVTGALSGLSGYDPSATNNADSLIANANKYVAGQDIPAAVKAAMQGATETARDVTMPGIEMNAAAGGNTNSSRTGIAQGLVQRGLAEQAGNLSATLTNKAYTDGLGLAEKQASGNNEGTLAALMGRGALGNSAAAGGVDASGNSLTAQQSQDSTAMAGGAGMQAAQQTQLDELLKKYQSGVSAPFDALKEYMGIVGTNNWGSQGTEHKTETKTPSAWEVIGGLMDSASKFMPGKK